MAQPLKSIFRTVAEAVNAKLVEILTAEGRAVPNGNVGGESDGTGGFVFGNTPFLELSVLPRIQWMAPSGSYVEEPKTGASKTPPADPPPPPLLVLRKQVHIWMWAATEEYLEHLTLTLPKATERSAYAKFFNWRVALEQSPTEESGIQVKNGTFLSRITVPLYLQVNAEIEGETTLVTVTADKLRAAITDDLASDHDDETEWQPEQWSG